MQPWTDVQIDAAKGKSNGYFTPAFLEELQVSCLLSID
jgi:hypothetical protein